MKKTIKITSVIGFIFTSAVGVLLHFIYELTSQNKLAAIFGSVNESTWEHLKLLFFPVLLFALIEFFVYGKNYPNFIPAKVFSLVIGMASIVVLFYTYSGILGTNYAPVDVLLFFIGNFVSYYLSYVIITDTKLFRKPIFSVVGIVIIILFIIAFAVFTFNPPEIGLFISPV